jgi:hypothetical protein
MIRIYESTSSQLKYRYQKEMGSVLFSLIRNNRIADFLLSQNVVERFMNTKTEVYQ